MALSRQAKVASIAAEYGTREAARRIGQTQRNVQRILKGDRSGTRAGARVNRVYSGLQSSRSRAAIREGRAQRITDRQFRAGNPELKSPDNFVGTFPGIEELYDYLTDAETTDPDGYGIWNVPIWYAESEVMAPGQRDPGDIDLYIGDTR